MLNISLKKLSTDAIVPTKNDGDAGYDLYSAEDYILLPGERRMFRTDIAITIPYGYYGRVAPRSGLAKKHGIDVLAGVIDSTYRGNIGVILLNTQKEEGFIEDISLEVKRGDRIAQIVFEKYHDAIFVEVDELDQTIRAGNGFGSTGS